MVRVIHVASELIESVSFDQGHKGFSERRRFSLKASELNPSHNLSVLLLFDRNKANNTVKEADVIIQKWGEGRSVLVADKEARSVHWAGPIIIFDIDCSLEVAHGGTSSKGVSSPLGSKVHLIHISGRYDIIRGTSDISFAVVDPMKEGETYNVMKNGDTYRPADKKVKP
jgi:hypothetical protein